jgi:LacI family transcriptional regulator
MAKSESSVNQAMIAKKLGLSIATVSRSLANHPAINAKTRERVYETARLLGYDRTAGRPGEGARGDLPVCVGVLVGLQRNSSPLATFPYILKGIQERAKTENVTVEVSYVDPNQFNPEARTDPVMKRIREGKWKGVILVYSFSPEMVESLAAKLAVVATLEDYDSIKIDSIDTNHHTGIVTLVNRLVALNHRRIGFVTWAYATSGHWATQRFAAYVSGIFTNGLEFQQNWILNAHKAGPTRDPSQIADEVVRLLREESVTAWICAADHQAYQLMLDLSTRGVRVPEDCSITGFDGIEPPLSLKAVTSLLVPNETIGAAALTRLMNRIDHPKAHQRKILVETQFLKGFTIAAPTLSAGK